MTSPLLAANPGTHATLRVSLHTTPTIRLAAAERCIELISRHFRALRICYSGIDTPDQVVGAGSRGHVSNCWRRLDGFVAPRSRRLQISGWAEPREDQRFVAGSVSDRSAFTAEPIDLDDPNVACETSLRRNKAAPGSRGPQHRRTARRTGAVRRPVAHSPAASTATPGPRDRSHRAPHPPEHPGALAAATLCRELRLTAGPRARPTGHRDRRR